MFSILHLSYRSLLLHQISIAYLLTFCITVTGLCCCTRYPLLTSSQLQVSAAAPDIHCLLLPSYRSLLLHRISIAYFFPVTGLCCCTGYPLLTSSQLQVSAAALDIHCLLANILHHIYRSLLLHQISIAYLLTKHQTWCVSYQNPWL